MPDTINAKSTDSKFRPHPEGQFLAQCVDVINLGDRVEQFPGRPQRLVQKCALVFRTGEVNEETGEAIDVSQEFSVSMGEKANLRKFLEQWRGKAYSQDQIEGEGVPLHKLAGNPALLTIAHHRTESGKTYANIMAIVGVPKQMQSTMPTFAAYERGDWWEKRKKDYAEAASKFRAESRMGSGKTTSDEYEDFPGALADEDDDLPF